MIKQNKEFIMNIFDMIINEAYENEEWDAFRRYERIKNREGLKYTFIFGILATWIVIYDIVYSSAKDFKSMIRWFKKLNNK